MTIANTLSFLQNSAGALTTGTINASGAPVTVSISGSEKIRVDTNGYLLVNYTSSVGSYHLQVQGNAYISGALTVGSLTAGAVTGSITTATSLAGGLAGQLHYQISPGLSGFVGPGTSGQVLISQGSSSPAYTNATNLSVGNSNYLLTSDDRTKAPADDNAGSLRFGFTSLANNNTAPYADYFHLRSYTDGTGGNDNLVMFRKDTVGMRIWQQTWGSASNYATYKDVALEYNTATHTTLSIGAAWFGGSTGEIRASNEITAYYTSDVRLKENVVVISNPIEKLEQIRGVYFDWTDEHVKDRGGEDGYFVRKHDIGVIAQEVEAILPEIVATRDNGYKAVKYEKIVPLLIECIKEQQTQINQILEKLEKLANK